MPLNFPADGEYVEHAPGQIERHGEGTHYSRDGLVYSGKWENDKMNGEGKSILFSLLARHVAVVE